MSIAFFCRSPGLLAAAWPALLLPRRHPHRRSGTPRPRALLCAALLASCLGGPAGALEGPTAARLRQSGVVTIAFRESIVPFSYLDANHQPIGYAIDLCTRVVEALRRELSLPALRVRYLPITSQDRIAVLTSGRADLECGSTTNTATRRRAVAFAVVHFIAAGKLLVRADSGIDEVQQVLANPARRLAANKGSTYLARLREGARNGLVKAMLVETTDVDDAFARLQRREVDAVLHDDVVLYSLRAGADNPASLRLLREPLSVEALGIMLRKDDPAFKKFVDLVLSRLMIDGDALRLYARWFQSPIPPRGVNLQFPPSYVLLDQFAYPNDHAGDDAPENLPSAAAAPAAAQADMATLPGVQSR